MSHSEKLFQIASVLDRYANYETSELDALIEAADNVGKSWSGSWLSYESTIYNRDFQPTDEVYKRGSKPQYHAYGALLSADWQTYSFHAVKQHINQKVGNPSIDRFSNDGKDATKAFKQAKAFALSFVYENFNTESDRFIQGWAEKIEGLEICTESDFIEFQRYANQRASKDQNAVKNNQNIGMFKRRRNTLGIRVVTSQVNSPKAIEEDIEIPPHITILAKVFATRHPFDSCKALNEQIVKLALHIQNIERTLLKGASGYQTDMETSAGSLEETSDRVEPLGESLDTPRHTFGNKVFIIHGRDDGVKGDVALFVRDLGLKEIILDRQPNEGLIAILDKFEREAKKADFAIALLTPDDVGALKDEAAEQLKPRARQNVIFELGYFIGKLGRKRVCLLLKGELENPSDLDGILYVSMNSPNGWKLELAREMKQAGLPIDPEKLL